MKKLSQAKLDSIVRGITAKKHIHGAVFQVDFLNDGASLTSASGNISTGGQFYIASINKLFLSAVTLRLCVKGQLQFSDKIAQYLPKEFMEGLHVYKGVDYSNNITIGHLISQTSGLPCYLIDKRKDGTKIMDELLQGVDQEWDTDRVIRQVKEMKPKFGPGQKGKAKYENTNFRLLGKVLEAVVKKPLDVIFTDLFRELNMHHTYVLQPDEKREFVPIFNNGSPVHIPRYLASSKYDIISNAQDLMIFLKAFFRGYFYPLNRLKELEQWNNIFFPFKYGIGIQKFYTPRLFSPFKRIPEMVGHCGSVGTAAFYIPEKGAFITGSVNQTQSPSTLFRTMISILNHM